jgi:hypothetical protein
MCYCNCVTATVLLQILIWSRKKPKRFKAVKPYNKNTALVECKNKRDVSKIRGNGKNRIKITQTVTEQHPGKARN